MNEFEAEVAKLKNGEMQTPASLQKIVEATEFKEWNILLRYDNGRPYIQIRFEDYDPFEHEVREQSCRKWSLSYYMKDTEVVDTVFAAVERAMRHEVHEMFKFNGRRVHNPHRNVYTLWDVSTGEENIDIRKPQDVE